MGYVVDIDELYSIQKAVGEKCSKCSSALETTLNNLQALSDADSLQGDLASSISAYLKEIHASILSSIGMALGTLQTRCYLYQDGYRAQIDSGLHAHIREDDLDIVKRHFYDIILDVDDVDEALSRDMEPVSDLIYLSAPSTSILITSLENVRDLCIKLGTSITQYESSCASNDFTDIDTVIANVQALITNQMGDKRVSVLDYQPGMASAMTDINALMESLQSIQDYQASVGDKLEAAFEREQQMLKDLQDERQWAKWVAVGICVIGSIALIAVTAGGATPLVCAGVGAVAGLTSAAANGFADNYVMNGSLVEGMEWKEFGKDCAIGFVTGAVMGYGGAVAHGSSVVKPMEKVMMNTATGIVENGSKGLINFGFDVGEAVFAGDASFEMVMSVAEESTNNMMRDITVGMAEDAVGGYVGGMFDAQAGDKTFWRTLGQKTIENMAEKEAKIGSGVTFDALTGAGSNKSGIEILSTIDYDMREGVQSFVKDEFSSAISSGVDAAIDNKFEDDKTVKGSIWKGAFKTANAAATNTAGGFASGALGQVMVGEDVDARTIWKEDLGGGTEVTKEAFDALGESVSGDIFKDREFANDLKQHDYNKDGEVEVVTFKNFSGYSVLKEDYDAAVESAGGLGYRGRRAQDILGLPRNVSLKDYNIEVQRYKTTDLKESEYKGKGRTNALKLETQ